VRPSSKGGGRKPGKQIMNYTTNHRRVSIALCIAGAVVAALAWKIFLTK